MNTGKESCGAPFFRYKVDISSQKSNKVGVQVEEIIIGFLCRSEGVEEVNVGIGSVFFAAD